MRPTSWTALLGLSATVIVAWSLGGRAGAGALAGFITGGTFAAGALALQRRAAMRRPDLPLAALLGGFLLKSFALLASVAAVRFVEPLAVRLDWIAFALGFGAAALSILIPATLETLKLVRPRSQVGPSRAPG